MKTTKRSPSLLLCVATPLFGGCFLGDSVVHKTVSLSLPVPAGTQSPSQAQVQEAFRIVDGVLTCGGFVRDRNPLTPQDQARGLLAFYGVCGVTLETNRLDIGFLDAYKAHFDAPSKKALKVLVGKLKNRYGAKSVKIKD
jgi:hypothetical protein